MNARYLVASLILLFSIACNTLFATPTPTATPVPPTDTPLPTATATATPSPTATPLPDYNGEWQGTTGQDKAISIKVEDNKVVSVTMETDMQSGGCTTNFKGTLGLDAPIKDGAFETSTGVYQGKFAISGTFTSEKVVEGSFLYTQTGGCPGSVEVDWTATREGSE